MPNSAKSLKESKSNRVEDFVAVASHFNVTHLVIFTASKAATYMKLARLPQGPTLTFKVDSFTLAREVRAAQRRPQGSARDYTSAPLQVLNGLGGPKDCAEGAGGGKSMKMSERQLLAEMLRGQEGLDFGAIKAKKGRKRQCGRRLPRHRRAQLQPGRVPARCALPLRPAERLRALPALRGGPQAAGLGSGHPKAHEVQPAAEPLHQGVAAPRCLVP